MELDYNEIDIGLIEASAGTRASECHGLITAYFVFNNELQMGLLRDHLVSGLEDAQALDQAYAVINKIAEDVASTLESEEIIFDLLIPDDDEPLTLRTQALSEWCAGFISGLGVAGLNEQHSLQNESEEFIQDLSKIARLETEPEEDEDSETAFVELIEYVRIGVLMLHQDWHPNTQLETGPRVLH